MWTIPVPDIRRTDYWIVHGRQPAGVAGFAARAAPTCWARSTRIRAAAGKVVVIDPRRTGTADRADEWMPIMPGTDAAFLLAICQRAVRRGARRPRRRSPTWSTASTTSRDAAAEFTPEAVAPACRRPGRDASAGSRDELPPRRAGRALRPHRAVQPGVRHAGVVAGRRGEHPRPATSTARAGSMFRKPVAWPITGCRRPRLERRRRSFGRWQQPGARRARGARPGPGVVPGRGDRDTRATGRSRRSSPSPATPCISAPGAGRLDAALPELECMISVDNWINETTRHAHVILPGPVAARAAALRRSHLGVGRRAARPTGPTRCSRPTPDRPHEWEILIRLGRLCTRRWRTRTSTSPRSTTGSSPRSAAVAGLDRADVARALRRAVARAHARPARCAPVRGATATARARRAHARDRSRRSRTASTSARWCRGWREVLRTPSGMVELAPPYITADVAAPRAPALDRPTPAASCWSAAGTSARTTRGCTTCKVLVKGKDRCTLLIHPDDAAGVGVVDGGRARVTSEAGTSRCRSRSPTR